MVCSQIAVASETWVAGISPREPRPDRENAFARASGGGEGIRNVSYTFWGSHFGEDATPNSF